jgi:membrane protease YdiL (CAAX protease family)
MDSTTTPNRSLASRIFFSPEERRLRAGWRLLGQAMLFTLFAAIAYFVLFPLIPEGKAFWLVEESIRLVAISAPVYLARRFLDHRSFVSLGLAWKSRAGRDMAAGFLIGGFSMTMIFLFEWAMGWLHVESFAWQVEPLTTVLSGVMIMFLIYAMTAWSEELQARGYWLQNLEEGLNLPWAFILSSLLFSLIHVANPGFSVMASMGLFMGGFDVAYGYIRTRQLWLPIGLHLGWNFFEGTVFGFQVSGVEGMPRLILQNVPGPQLWTGGAFGPEAGVLMIVAVGVNIVLIYFYSRISD